MPVIENEVDVSRLQASIRDTSQWNTKIVQVYVPASWLPERRKVSDRQGNQMAEALGAEQGRVAASKKLLSGSKLDSYRAVRNHLRKTIDRWTWVTGGGMRAIRLRDVEEFEAELETLRAQMTRIISSIQSEWYSIIEAERAALGDAFSERDYRVSWSRLEIGNTRYMELSIPNFLPSAVLEKQRQVIEEETRRVAASAVENAINPVIEQLRVFAQRLEPAMRLNPEDPRYVHLKGAELVFKMEEAEDPSIPDGHLRLRVRRQEGKKTSSDDVDIPIGDFPLLRAAATNKARMRLDDKAVKAVKAQLESLNALKDFGGPLTATIEEAAKRLTSIAEGGVPARGSSFGDVLRQTAANLQEVSLAARACVSNERSL